MHDFLTALIIFFIPGSLAEGELTFGGKVRHKRDQVVPASLLTSRQDMLSDAQRPLVVDLDGTLVRTDTALECLLALLKRPLLLWRALLALRHGKARLKQSLAEAARLDAAALPYNQDVVEYLREQQAAGRVLVLATGSDRSIAEAVAQHLDLVAAPSSYRGRGRADLAVWCEAETGICVNARRGVARAAAQATMVERSFASQTDRFVPLLQAIRPHQWSKNLLVFVPLVGARAIDDVAGWAEALVMFVAFCCAASSIYLINDVCDLSADRRHPRKSRRPLASGALPLHLGLAAAPLLLLAGLALGAAVGALPVLLLYAALSCVYSLWLKSLPLVDVFVLAGLYGIRLLAGGIATGYHVSLWLLAFSSFLFLGLAIVKRVAELMILPAGGQHQASGRGYRAEDLPILQLMGVASSFVASLVLALYVQNELALPGTRESTLSWAIVPLVLFWECRIWLAPAGGKMDDDPIVFAARDWVSWAVAAGCLGVLLFDQVIRH